MGIVTGGKIKSNKHTSVVLTNESKEIENLIPTFSLVPDEDHENHDQFGNDYT